MKKLILLLITSYLLSPIFSYAQINVGSGPALGSLADELNVTLIPTYPRPNENVHVGLEMYTENLDSSLISWYVDNKLKTSGQGLKSFSFKTGAAGSKTNLSISVRLQSGTEFTKDITVVPAGVQILWQASSYTPPFYRGKALFSPQGTVRLQAKLQFNPTDTSFGDNSNLIYKWSVNGEVAQNFSGFNKNSVSMNGSILGLPLVVDVLVTDPLTGVTGQGNIVVNPHNPFLVFYENNPLYGMIFEKAMSGEITLQNQEINILAVPYNTSSEDINNIKYSWRVGGQSADGLSGRSAIFRKPEGAGGSSSISLETENSRRPLQSGKNNLLINFK